MYVDIQNNPQNYLIDFNTLSFENEELIISIQETYKEKEQEIRAFWSNFEQQQEKKGGSIFGIIIIHMIKIPLFILVV